MSVQIGIAPDSWGVWFPRHEKQPPWDRCLDEMQAAGYAGVELGPWGYLPNDPEQLKKELESRQLQLVAGTVAGDFLNDDATEPLCARIDEIATLLKTFPTARYMVLLPAMYTDEETGRLLCSPELTDAQWTRYARNVQAAVDCIRQHGLEAAFHPHADSHVQTEAQIERLLKETTTSLCLDTGHHVYGGGEPISFYRKNADRIPFLHVKDCDMSVKRKKDAHGWSFARAVAEGIMVEPGAGDIDYTALRNTLESCGYDGWVVVEQDLFPLTSFDIPFPIAERSLQKLKAAGF